MTYTYDRYVNLIKLRGHIIIRHHKSKSNIIIYIKIPKINSYFSLQIMFKNSCYFIFHEEK